MFSKVLGFGSPGAGSPMPSSWTPSQRAPTQATAPANRPSVDEWLANVRDRTDELTGRKYDSAQQQRVFLDVLKTFVKTPQQNRDFQGKIDEISS